MATVAIERVYEDGSGAPALVTVQGWTFACDFVGEVRSNLLTKSSSRRPAKWMGDYVRAQYLKALRAAAPASWFDLNATMYAK